MHCSPLLHRIACLLADLRALRSPSSWELARDGRRRPVSAPPETTAHALARAPAPAPSPRRIVLIYFVYNSSLPAPAGW
eukprot:6213969-Pleurochrysis_carterae.AAC.1